MAKKSKKKSRKANDDLISQLREKGLRKSVAEQIAAASAGLEGLSIGPLADAVGMHYKPISAVFSGVADLKKAFAEAETMPRTDKQSAHGLVRATEVLLRSGAFGLVVLDLSLSIGQFLVPVGLLNENHEPVMSWKVQRAFPVKLEGPQLKASANEVAQRWRTRKGLKPEPPGGKLTRSCRCNSPTVVLPLPPLLRKIPVLVKVGWPPKL